MKHNILSILTVVALMMIVSCAKSNKETATDNTVNNETVKAQEEVSDTNDTSMSFGAENYKVVDGKLLSVNNRPLLVDFSATWCMPCREFKPIFKKVSKSFIGIVDFCSIDVDDNKELAEQYEITSIPCVVYISADGKEIGRSVGLLDAAELSEKVKSHFDL